MGTAVICLILTLFTARATITVRIRQITAVPMLSYDLPYRAHIPEASFRHAAGTCGIPAGSAVTAAASCRTAAAAGKSAFPVAFVLSAGTACTAAAMPAAGGRNPADCPGPFKEFDFAPDIFNGSSQFGSNKFYRAGTAVFQQREQFFHSGASPF